MCYPEGLQAGGAPRAFQGWDGGGGRLRNSRRFLNKRNLRRVGEIMRNANLTQSFSISRLLPCLSLHVSNSQGPEKAMEPCALLCKLAELMLCVCGEGEGVV